MSFRVSWSSSTTRTVRGCFAGDEGDSETDGFIGDPGRLVVVAVSIGVEAPAEVPTPGGSDKGSGLPTGVPMSASDKKAGGTGCDCSSEFDGKSSLGLRSHRSSGRDGVISTRPSVKGDQPGP